jgi:N-acetylglutamate synthase-like GNAT family acetyltransferase
MQRVADLMIARGYAAPNPMLSTAFIAEENGEIVGFCTLQAVTLLEPLEVIAPEHRDGTVALRLMRMAEAWVREKEIPRVLLHTENASWKRILIDRLKARLFPEQFMEWMKPSIKTGTTAEMVEQ